MLTAIEDWIRRIIREEIDAAFEVASELFDGERLPHNRTPNPAPESPPEEHPYAWVSEYLTEAWDGFVNLFGKKREPW